MQPYQKVKCSLRSIVVNNFIGGISWGLGASIGLTFVLAIIAFVISKINTIPIVGNFVVEVTQFVLQNNPHLFK
jgi:hypothetical protein